MIITKDCFGYAPRRNDIYDNYCSRKEMKDCPFSKRVNYAVSGDEFAREFVNGREEWVERLWCDVVIASCFERHFIASE